MDRVLWRHLISCVFGKYALLTEMFSLCMLPPTCLFPRTVTSTVLFQARALAHSVQGRIGHGRFDVCHVCNHDPTRIVHQFVQALAQPSFQNLSIVVGNLGVGRLEDT